MIDLRREDLEGETGRSLLDYIRNRRWFGQKSMEPETVNVLDIIPLDRGKNINIVIVEIGFAGNGNAIYSLPITVSLNDDEGTIASTYSGDLRIFLRDAFFDPAYTEAVIRGIAADADIKGMIGTVKFFKTRFFTMPAFQRFETVRSEQSNSSSIVDRLIIVKNYRYLQSGENPDLEMSMALVDRSGFSNVPRPMGYALYEGRGMRLYLAGSFQFLDGSVDAWTYYTGRFTSLAENLEDFQRLKSDIVRLGDELGKITGNMHRSLSLIDDHAFKPEPLQIGDLQGIVIGSVEYTRKCLELLGPYAEKNGGYLERLGKISEKVNFNSIAEKMLSGLTVTGMKKIRVHGDYHLGQILIWNDAFYIIDFEGEPVRSMEERRRKQSPMKDLAGLIRSMDYLVSYVVLKTGNERLADEKDTILNEVRRTIIDSYKKAFTGYCEILPGNGEKFNDLLDIFILDKSSYELIYEINNRPEWIEIPLNTVMNILENSMSSGDAHKNI